MVRKGKARRTGDVYPVFVQPRRSPVNCRRDGLVHIVGPNTSRTDCGIRLVTHAVASPFEEPTDDAPTCLQCLGATQPVVFRIPEESWGKP